MIVIMLIVLILLLGFLCLKLLVALQGDAKFVFSVENSRPWKIKRITENKVAIITSFPFQNNGRQDGTLIDVFPRVQLPFEQYDKLNVNAKIYWQQKPRYDGYWECFIFPKGFCDEMLVELTFQCNDADMNAAMKEIPNFYIDIYYQAVSRKEYYIDKKRMKVVATTIQDLVFN